MGNSLPIRLLVCAALLLSHFAAYAEEPAPVQEMGAGYTAIALLIMAALIVVPIVWWLIAKKKDPQDK